MHGVDEWHRYFNGNLLMSFTYLRKYVYVLYNIIYYIILYAQLAI